MPAEFKKYFWDTDFSKLDIKKNINYIISRLFCEGNLDAIRFIKNTYSESEIIKAIKETRNLNKVTANFLKNIYNLKEDDMQYYRNIKNMNYVFMG